MKYLLTFFAFLLLTNANAQLTELPITLSMPFDEDTIEESEPVFIWQCNLAALQTDPRLSQRITVVKLLENQTPLEGLSVNNPVFIRENLLTTTLPYSATDHELIDNTWYAWQVSYLMNNMVIGQSEAWKFIKVTPEKPPHPVVKLKRQADLSYYTLHEPAVYFTTDEGGNFVLKGRLKDSKGTEYPIDISETINGEPISAGIQTGSIRFFKADFGSLNLENGDYTFYWEMARNRTNVIHLILQQ